MGSSVRWHMVAPTNWVFVQSKVMSQVSLIVQSGTITPPMRNGNTHRSPSSCDFQLSLRGQTFFSWHEFICDLHCHSECLILGWSLMVHGIFYWCFFYSSVCLLHDYICCYSLSPSKCYSLSRLGTAWGLNEASTLFADLSGSQLRGGAGAGQREEGRCAKISSETLLLCMKFIFTSTKLAKEQHLFLRIWLEEYTRL